MVPKTATSRPQRTARRESNGDDCGSPTHMLWSHVPDRRSVSAVCTTWSVPVQYRLCCDNRVNQNASSQQRRSHNEDDRTSRCSKNTHKTRDIATRFLRTCGNVPAVRFAKTPAADASLLLLAQPHGLRSQKLEHATKSRHCEPALFLRALSVHHNQQHLSRRTTIACSQYIDTAAFARVNVRSRNR